MADPFHRSRTDRPARCDDPDIAKTRWYVKDGPLEGEVLALDAEGGQFSITLADDRVAVYQTSGRNDLIFVGIDPFG